MRIAIINVVLAGGGASEKAPIRNGESRIRATAVALQSDQRLPKSAMRRIGNELATGETA